MPIENETQNSGAEQEEEHEKTRDGNAGNLKARKPIRQKPRQQSRDGGCCSGEPRKSVTSRKRVIRAADLAEGTVAKTGVSGFEVNPHAAQIVTPAGGVNGCGGRGRAATQRGATAGAAGNAGATARLAASVASMAAEARAEAGGETVPKVKRKRPRKRVRFGTALRKRGIDEHMLADTFVYIFEVLRGMRAATESDKRLLVEMVKECTKTLEMESKVLASAANAPPEAVILVHNVARPKRPALPAAAAKAEKSK